MAQGPNPAGEDSVAPDTPCCLQDGKEESGVVWEGVRPSLVPTDPPVLVTRVPTLPSRGKRQWNLYAEKSVTDNRRGGD